MKKSNSSVVSNINLALLTFFITAIFLEVFFRIIGYDFDKTLYNFQKTPIYYRKPTEPSGSVFFKRPGPDEWTGKVLYKWCELNGVSSSEYINEKVYTFKYSDEGLRNSNDLNNWEIAVVGDSFVELGYLRDEEIFTSLINQKTNLKVKNIGISHSGFLSYVHYLKKFSLSKNLKHVFIFFFEGNDLADTQKEQAALKELKKQGKRPERNIHSSQQTSLITAVFKLLKIKKNNLEVNAELVLDKKKYPVNIFYAPPTTAEIPDNLKLVLANAFKEISILAKEKGISAHIVFTPSKHRTYYDLIKYKPNAKPNITSWKPSDLPNFIKKISQDNDLDFINLTEPLKKHILNNNPVYNGTCDSHFNAEGSKIVAEVLISSINSTQIQKQTTQ